MEKYWKYLSLAYVTEESDDLDNPNGLIEHKIEWRSESEYTFRTLNRVHLFLRRLEVQFSYHM